MALLMVDSWPSISSWSSVETHVSGGMTAAYFSRILQRKADVFLTL